MKYDADDIAHNPYHLFFYLNLYYNNFISLLFCLKFIISIFHDIKNI